ncbi:MAG: NfeD family protein [Dehalococcoidia bacterium]|nr:NfeD family protein [Dehalococcoidia bacterium]
MCHLLLLMPLFGLALFLVLPLPIALPAYLLVLVASVMLFYKVMQAMKQPVYVGREALLGQEVEVVAATETPCRARYLVRQGGELWSALSECQLNPGEKARIVSFEGTMPRVEPLGGEAPAGAITNRRETCH